MTVTIRDATSADVTVMIDLLAHLFEQETEFAPDARTQRQGLEMVLADPGTGVLLLAEMDGIPVGMVNLLYTVSTALGARVALLEDMVVAPESRRCGVGRTLLDAAIVRAEADGCRRITLLTDGDNKAAQRFYSRAGFARSDMVAMRLIMA